MQQQTLQLLSAMVSLPHQVCEVQLVNTLRAKTAFKQYEASEGNKKQEQNKTSYDKFTCFILVQCHLKCIWVNLTHVCCDFMRQVCGLQCIQ